MLKLLGAIAVAALVAGCGSSDPAPSAATAPPTATPEPEPETEQHVFDKGHSRAVREYYRHTGGDAQGNIEAEYHQPPKPATGGIGDTITLTGTSIGLRIRVTLTGLVDPATPPRPPRGGTRYVGAKRSLRNTGITKLEAPFTNASLSFRGGRRARLASGVKAGCSNGLHEVVELDVSRRTRGCVLFQVPAGERPRQLQLALEQVPAEAGGRWHLK